ncbi:bifunctional glutamate N-acetyltransferase/amino-acid acetyltransferase ArgJ [Tindallia californiensis]|uniref:Arginine biosynthesis bifunctional protein ArgJ n=1 Tax=Tindallia californiensis TaxID=159292 RepID=A0A1H3IGH7_9FIRM|nr:bifunctional glutamate N-acetyltransferase/amino-acid acetyltransferase ArgJ [Tindallia californiensis]SDY26732.1 glutamate N-acetyltransferase [Tindallia californiensis]
MKNSNTSFKIVDNGSITSPKGFLASGICTGVKENEQLDLALIYCKKKAVAAGVFTQNNAMAAPVIISKEILKRQSLKAIIINSGNANACTGKRGMEDAETIQKTTAAFLDIDSTEVAIASTGVIGVPLPMDNIIEGIPEAAKQLSKKGGKAAAQGIMTTDTINKEIAVEIELDGKIATIAGIAKGSGMIHPNMATMLGFITTDIVISPSYFQAILREITEGTFNMVTVDGDTSTNDSVIAMANGESGNREMNENHPQKDMFVQALQYVCEYLAKSIAKDGEGASKFIEVEAHGFITVSDARKAAKTIAGSNLVKTAIFGEDGNWGRMICSLGYSGVPFDMEGVKLNLSDGQEKNVKVLENGLPLEYDEELVTTILKNQSVRIIVEANNGSSSATAWGCDLTYDYIKINGSYRS